MNEELETAKEFAKAGQEIAKTAGKVIDAGSDLARFCAKALGTVPEDLVGVAGGDYLREVRIRNLDSLMRKTEKKLQDRGVEEPRPLNTKLALPLLDAASEESDETLQDMWSSLMANAMDPDRDVSLQRIFIDTLKQFDPVDALVFKAIATAYHEPSDQQMSDDRRGRNAVNAATALPLRPTQFDLSREKLVKLGCLGSNYSFTSLSKELWFALEKDGAS